MIRIAAAATKIAAVFFNLKRQQQADPKAGNIDQQAEGEGLAGGQVDDREGQRFDDHDYGFHCQQGRPVAQGRKRQGGDQQRLGQQVGEGQGDQDAPEILAARPAPQPEDQPFDQDRQWDGWREDDLNPLQLYESSAGYLYCGPGCRVFLTISTITRTTIPRINNPPQASRRMKNKGRL